MTKCRFWSFLPQLCHWWNKIVQRMKNKQTNMNGTFDFKCLNDSTGKEYVENLQIYQLLFLTPHDGKEILGCL